MDLYYPLQKSVLENHISEERNMFVSENFIRSLISRHSKHILDNDGDTRYPQTCKFLDLRHILYSPLEKSNIGMVI